MATQFREVMDLTSSQPPQKDVPPQLRPPPQPLIAKTAAVKEAANDEGGGLQGMIPSPLVAEHGSYLWNVHSYTNNYIRFSDAKAGVVIGFCVAALVGLHSTPYTTELIRSSLMDWSLGLWAAALATVAFMGGACSAAWSIRPRLTNTQKRGFVFWDSIRGFGNVQDFVANLSKQSSIDLNKHLAEHLFTLADVCSKKYTWVNRGVLLALIGGLLGAFAVVTLARAAG